MYTFPSDVVAHCTGFIPLVRMKETRTNPLLVSGCALLTSQRFHLWDYTDGQSAKRVEARWFDSIAAPVSIILLIFTKDYREPATMSELDPLCGYTEETVPTYNQYNRMKKSITGRRNCKLAIFSLCL